MHLLERKVTETIWDGCLVLTVAAKRSRLEDVHTGFSNKCWILKNVCSSRFLDSVVSLTNNSNLNSRPEATNPSQLTDDVL